MNFQTFGVPKTGRKASTPRVTEKYDFPVMTLHALPTEPKHKARIHFNTAACALLGLELKKKNEVKEGAEQPLVAFNYEYLESTGKLYIANVTGMEGNFNKIYSNGFISSKVDCEYIFNNYPELDSTKEYEFTLELIPVEGMTVAVLNPMEETVTELGEGETEAVVVDGDAIPGTDEADPVHSIDEEW